MQRIFILYIEPNQINQAGLQTNQIHSYLPWQDYKPTKYIVIYLGRTIHQPNAQLSTLAGLYPNQMQLSTLAGLQTNQMHSYLPWQDYSYTSTKCIVIYLSRTIHQPNAQLSTLAGLQTNQIQLSTLAGLYVNQMQLSTLVALQTNQMQLSTLAGL